MSAAGRPLCALRIYPVRAMLRRWQLHRLLGCWRMPPVRYRVRIDGSRHLHAPGERWRQANVAESRVWLLACNAHANRPYTPAPIVQCPSTCFCNAAGRCTRCRKPHGSTLPASDCRPCSADGSCDRCMVPGTCLQCARGWRMAPGHTCVKLLQVSGGDWCGFASAFRCAENSSCPIPPSLHWLQCPSNCRCDAWGRCLRCRHSHGCSGPHSRRPCSPCDPHGRCAACSEPGTCLKCVHGWRLVGRQCVSHYRWAL